MPDGNLNAMPKPITDQQRASIIHQYLASGLTQDCFCAALAATEDIHVSPRTLRAWCSRLGPPQEPMHETVEVVSEAIEKLQGVLEWLQAGHQEAAIGTVSQVAANLASADVATTRPASETQTDAAAPLPIGMPGGKSHKPIEFIPTEEPPVPEKPRRRPGRIVWEE